MLNQYNNYYIYGELLTNHSQYIRSKDIIIDNWYDNYNGILNIMKDGIEDREIQSLFITVDFGNNEIVDLTIMDYYLNLIMWRPLLVAGETIKPQHLFFFDETTAGDVKNYFDKYFIEPNRLKLSNRILNNAIADTLYYFTDIDIFSLFIADTLALEDDCDLMDKCPQYNEYIHCDLSDVSLEQTKDEGLNITYKAIEFIKNSKKYIGYDHCLKNAFAAQEGINVRQFKENHFHIGTKPDGLGSIYHDPINTSYIRGLNYDENSREELRKRINLEPVELGKKRLDSKGALYQLIDSGASRVAQIISKKEVGDSGAFARIVGLNNVNSFLYPDPNYDCGTKNFIHVTVYNQKILNLMNDRYYRLHPKGIEYKINSKTDKFLIGKDIYLRSPITCASHAAGKGVCFKCYGDLAYTNIDINIGRIASELITSRFTQNRLSAKHLLETKISVIPWCPEFSNFFDIDVNIIRLSSEFSDELGKYKGLSGYKLILNLDSIQLENDDEFFKHEYFSTEKHTIQDNGPFYNEFITEFYIEDPEGKSIKICSIPTDDTGEAKMYISEELAHIIQEFIKRNEIEEDEENIIELPIEEIEDTAVFLLKIENNDLGKNLDVFEDLINKKQITKSYTKDQLVERLQDNILKSNLKSQSIHLEVMISNQICCPGDYLHKPNWLNEDEPYELLALSEALTNNPSIINTLLYQKLLQTFGSPISYNKIQPSVFDPLFMRQPKKFLNCDHEIWDEINKPTIREGEHPLMFVKDHGPGVQRPKNVKEFVAKFENREKTEIDD